jgi:anaerobic selenocysteine-containing dehydrogenase
MHQTRRQFLKTVAATAAGTAAVVAPSVVRGKKPVQLGSPVQYGKMGFTMIKRKRPTPTILILAGNDFSCDQAWVCVNVIEH